ncbi:hypothetical protein L5G32_17480 [Gordonia sp. HY002]|uniref:hypothetical protein n=1 Tax=Gordonia zhenghanii TaxID=2911516 RepID=UPI001EEFE49D|nr:hypothetical protein [Gordonia zhenghanii]MCF8572062.1 hypothetical protein [Gordonia zhenghanii]MCF8602936.1 hypothetical protein [Gordonia zhenghanii]
MAINPPERGIRAGDDRQRLRKLAQAAMNADQTVGQVETLLADMGPLLMGLTRTTGSLDETLAGMDATIAKMDATLNKVDTTVEQMATVVGRLEAVTSRVEQVVLIVEAALRPIGVVESAGRAIVSRLGVLGRE